ncbi:hypothetical protein A7K91_01140 [Paenibacillus oryzae]|uniref:Uncharacterized protein n=1 Tax=Paenibacillus oryzae TaxID=1844972 RepID=A0A1A5YA50_9BACL|nr:hypothetical protein A7K91_01140 [Paenibacillus oryzae]
MKHWLDQREGVGSWGKYILLPIYSSIERLKYGIRVPFTKIGDMARLALFSLQAYQKKFSK